MQMVCAPGRTRTYDLEIRSLLLYPLSYGRSLSARRLPLDGRMTLSHYRVPFSMLPFPISTNAHEPRTLRSGSFLVQLPRRYSRSRVLLISAAGR